MGRGLPSNPKSGRSALGAASRAGDGLPKVAAQWVRGYEPSDKAAEPQWELACGNVAGSPAQRVCYLAGRTQQCGSVCASQKKTRASQKGCPTLFPGVVVKGLAHKGAIKTPTGPEPALNRCHPDSKMPSYPEQRKNFAPSPVSPLSPPCTPIAKGSQGAAGAAQT